MSGPLEQAGTRRLAFRLMIADSMVLAAVAAFITSVPLWKAALLDAPILFLWSALPIMASRVPQRRRFVTRGLVISALALGGILGWQFIKLRVPVEHEMGWELQTALLVFWASGFLIVQPLTYRLFDALALGALAIGMLEERAWGIPLVALALIAWFDGLSLRHRLFDLSSARLPGRPLNAAIRGFMLAVGIMALVFFGTMDFFKQSQTFLDGPLGDLRSERRRIGWGDGPILSDLQRSEFSEEPLFRLEFRRWPGGPKLRASEEMVPYGSFLWRTRVVDEFVGSLLTWRARPPRDAFYAALPIAAPRSSGVLTARLERISSRIDLIPTLYGSGSAHLVTSEAKGARLVASGTSVLVVEVQGDPSFVQGDLIDLELESNRALIDRPGRHHLMLPEHPRLQARLRQLTARSRGTVAERVRSLETFYKTFVDYQLEASWPQLYDSQEDKLLGFLTEHRSGDCNYFAMSSCLLLRSLGIHARLVQGFLGLRWDPELRDYVIIEGTAHRWTEYHDGQQWRPFDATQFSRNSAGPSGGIGDQDLKVDDHETASAAPDTAKKSQTIWQRIAGNEEDSRWAMLFFLCPVLAVLLAIVFKKSDVRRRPKRSEVESDSPQQTELPELALGLAGETTDLRLRTLRLYVAWQRRLARSGRQRKLAETPRRHAERVAHDHMDTAEDLKELAQLVDQACYGPHEPDAEALARLERRFRD